MARRGSSSSIAQDVYRRIRSGIFNGELRPGARIQSNALGVEYGTSTTVVREALQLLVGERLVRADAGRGFFVPEVVPTEVTDLTTVRCEVDSIALRLSIERGDLVWESAVMAAHHLLSRTPRYKEGGHVMTEEWAEVHRDFHLQLLAACGSPVILDLCGQLQGATELYRVAVGSVPKAAGRDVDAEHRLIVEAVLARDADLAVERLTQHYRATADLIAEAGRSAVSAD